MAVDHTGPGGLALAAVLLMTAIVADVLTAVYVFVYRPVGRILYIGAVLLTAATLVWVGPLTALEFVTDLSADVLIWIIRLSFVFLAGAPFLKRRRSVR